MPLATIQDFDFKLIIALAKARFVRQLNQEFSDLGLGDECLLSKFKTGMCLNFGLRHSF
jgi:hypothetical protein